MAKKFLDNKVLKPEVLAAQLRKPSGEMANELADEMNKGNFHICQNSYSLVNLKDNEHVLEIGMGNGKFTDNLISRASNIRYTGLDYSSEMVEASIINNQELIKTGNVNFIEGSIDAIPYANNTFDHIVTTNTLYFWPNPIESAKELLRVLKPDGKLIIAYRSKETLEKIEFTKHGFKKYNIDQVEKLIKGSGFTNVKTKIIDEPDIDFGEVILKIQGFYTLGTK